MIRCWLVVTAGLCLTASAAAQGQRPIQWISNQQQGVAQAKRTGLPVLFYIPGRGGGGEGGDLKDAQQRAFRDPLVRGIAEQRFVAIRLPRSNETKELLRQMGVPGEARYCLVSASPAGDLIGVIPPGQMVEPKVLARQMTALFRKYRVGLFKRELKPKLEDEAAKAGDITKALKVIEKLLITEADESVAKLLERGQLSKTVKKRVYSVLAELSTPKCVDALLTAAVQDKLAANALAKCTPAAAERMLPALDLDEPEQKFLIVYGAVTKICKIKKTKPRGFWGGQNERLISAEIERVEAAVGKSAKRWRDKFEAYR